ncbi:hypothetical protein NDU88_005526 [Pleurodeles waltl]|uniref:Uncharacterized protein n=1 Tax=Pleurodeles waltl TaxID=8319 RepID=A0AAV7NPA1_PLEWA|nr:hypothetical protein NDU88_005526 [Pleurodeles waltl]
MTPYIRLTEVPATPTAESGAEFRAALPENAPPGRLSNDHVTDSSGNPEIRVPEKVESADGLRAQGEDKEEKDANKGEETRNRRPEAENEDRSRREVGGTNAQARSATERNSEKQEFCHVPGGTWLNQGKIWEEKKRQGEDKEEKDANKGEETRNRRPEAENEDRSRREVGGTNAQAQSATERNSEKQEFCHVPGGTGLNQFSGTGDAEVEAFVSS